MTQLTLRCVPIDISAKNMSLFMYNSSDGLRLFYGKIHLP
uniref:Uncharacterized protein n=1 Tax=Anguilla anguilla TaxID=7936 RepID=A0A0E9XDS3_ANGAN